MHWWGDIVYTSELGFLCDLPYLITHDAAQRNTGRFRTWLFAARIALNTLGCAAVTEGHVVWGGWALAISAGFHAVSYIHAFWHRLRAARQRTGLALSLADFRVLHGHAMSKRGEGYVDAVRRALPNVKLGPDALYAAQAAILARPRAATSGNGRLFLLAHAGILNFFFQLPGRGVPAVRLTRTLQLFVTLTVGIVFAFTLTTITPLEDAWGCYVPAHVVSLADYNHGTCEVPNAPACRVVPVVNCGVAHGAIFNAELHYATQAMIVSFVVYITGSFANWDAHFGA